MRQKIQDPIIAERLNNMRVFFNKMSLKNAGGYEMYFCSHVVNVGLTNTGLAYSTSFSSDEDINNSKINWGIFSGGEPIDNMGVMDYPEYLELLREWKLNQLGI